MSSAWIRARSHEASSRHPKGHRTWQVCYRLGGRGSKVWSAGSFPVKREAEKRRELVGGWIALGLDPQRELARVAAPPRRERFDELVDAMAKTRRDVGDKARARYANAKGRMGELAALDPREVTVRDLQEWLAANDDLAPATVASYMSVYRQTLDHADVDTNPAKSSKLRLPARGGEEVDPFSWEDWQRVVPFLRAELLLPFRLMEACALRTGEVTKLELGDVDFAEGRFRISAARTKRRTAGQRWIAVPQPLVEEIAGLWPLEDRVRGQRVFPQLKEWTLRHEMTRALKLAGAAQRHPHQLRHRRVSLWFRHGLDEVTISRWAGHSKASMSLDVYAHVLIDSRDEWHDFWLGAYADQVRVRAGEGLGGSVRVLAEEGGEG